MSEHEEVVDIPEPERALRNVDRDESEVDPGGDAPAPPERGPGLGEDPRYDPGGTGREPGVGEDEDGYG